MTDNTKTKDIAFNSYYSSGLDTEIYDWETHRIINREKIVALHAMCSRILQMGEDGYAVHQRCFNRILAMEDGSEDIGENECKCDPCSYRFRLADHRIYRKQQNLLPRKFKDGNVYLMGNSRNRYVKIGFSFKDPVFRETTLQAEDPEIVLICSWRGTMQDEKKLHERFSDKRLRGEWFKLSPQDISDLAREFGVIS